MHLKFKKRSIFGAFRSTQNAMVFSFSVLIIIAMISFMLIALNTTRSSVFDNSIEYTTKITNQVRTDIEDYFSYMENISSLVVESPDVKLFLNPKDAAEATEGKERLISQFNIIKESRKDISNIGIITDDQHYLLNNGESKLTGYLDVRNFPWYMSAQTKKGQVAISSTHVQNAIADSYKWVITLSRSIKEASTNGDKSVFFIDLNYESISDLCDANSIGQKGYIFIIDEKGDVIYHPNQQLMFGGLKRENIAEIMRTDKDSIIMESGDDEIIYTMSKSDKLGWTIVGATYGQELLEGEGKIRSIYLLTTMALLIAVIIISGFISREITKPIRKLTHSMSLVERGEFKKAGVDVMTNNELGSLTKSFNSMTERIDSLMRENVQEQRAKRKSEMKALQAQINPHFLYNTLDSIIWMSEAGRNEEVVLMTSALAKLFRQSISNEKEEVLIREEIEYVKNYLVIQKMRYKDKLDYEFEIEEDILNVSIIKFALQPLVENAIYHGLKYKDSKGKILIRGYAKNEDVFLEIIDDGIGMKKEQLEHLFDEKERVYKSNGVGVNNVKNRLNLYYGKGYGLLFRSEEGKGTTATIVIPKYRRSDEETNS